MLCRCAVGCKLDRAIARSLTLSAGEDPGPLTSLGDGALRGRGGDVDAVVGERRLGCSHDDARIRKESLNLFGNADLQTSTHTLSRTHSGTQALQPRYSHPPSADRNTTTHTTLPRYTPARYLRPVRDNRSTAALPHYLWCQIAPHYAFTAQQLAPNL
jgi:hypothetical protein